MRGTDISEMHGFFAQSANVGRKRPDGLLYSHVLPLIALPSEEIVRLLDLVLSGDLTMKQMAQQASAFKKIATMRKWFADYAINLHMSTNDGESSFENVLVNRHASSLNFG